jgi:hypothetical protein
MPQYSLAKVVDARGTVFDTIGFTVRRRDDTHKRLELLPEEVLYMVERGSMLCWRESLNAPPREEDDACDPIKLIGEPMSAQQCFAEMLGVGGITLEHYQVGHATCFSPLIPTTLLGVFLPEALWVHGTARKSLARKQRIHRLQTYTASGVIYDLDQERPYQAMGFRQPVAQDQLVDSIPSRSDLVFPQDRTLSCVLLSPSFKIFKRSSQHLYSNPCV